MVKVSVITTAGRKSDLFAEHQTPREILEYFDIDYSTATNTIDGVRLDPAGMDKSLKDWGVGEACRISSIVKIDNAASVKINGASAVLISDVKLEDWQRLEKYAPEALTIVDEEGDPVFKVMTGSGSGSINKNGVVFGCATNDGGKATVTTLIDPCEEDKIGAVRDVMGSALLDLIEIEKDVPTLLKDIEEKEAEIAKLIVAE